MIKSTGVTINRRTTPEYNKHYICSKSAKTVRKEKRIQINKEEVKLSRFQGNIVLKDFTSWKCKLAQPLQKSVWWFLGKMEAVLPQDRATPFLSVYQKDASAYQKDNTQPCSQILYS